MPAYAGGTPSCILSFNKSEGKSGQCKHEKWYYECAICGNFPINIQCEHNFFLKEFINLQLCICIIYHIYAVIFIPRKFKNQI